MKRFKVWLGICLLGLALGLGSTARAQDGGDEDAGVGPVLTLKEKLQLSDAQVAKLTVLKAKARAELGPMVAKQIVDLAILGKKVKDGAGDEELKPVLGRLALRHAGIESAKGRYWGQALALLDTTQQAKVVLVSTALYLDALKTVRDSWRQRLSQQ